MKREHLSLVILQKSAVSENLHFLVPAIDQLLSKDLLICLRLEHLVARIQQKRLVVFESGGCTGHM